MNSNRRQYLRGTLAAGLYFSTSGLLSGCGEATARCADPENLSAGERQMRKTLVYVETSAIADRNCGNCRFFHAGDTPSGCGQCELLDGAVNRAGHCSSWAS
ncbi:MAG: high-potential iron-sulfur protein [Halioglobus sp.]